jgi:GNAT superfamily N-acetyltransferase
MNTIRIAPSAPQYVLGAEDVQHANYGTTREQPADTMTARHFLHHLQIFPEGQFVALERQPDRSERVVGMTASMRIRFDPESPFIEPWFTTIDDGWLYKHDPRGEWMYGVESAVLPDYQGHGIGGKLMEARFATAKRLNLRGMVAGSALMSYPKVAASVSPADYVRGVVAGTYFDNNLTKQIKKGFTPLAIIPDYLPYPDPADTWGAVIVWHNPDYAP